MIICSSPLHNTHLCWPLPPSWKAVFWFLAPHSHWVPLSAPPQVSSVHSPPTPARLSPFLSSVNLPLKTTAFVIQTPDSCWVLISVKGSTTRSHGYSGNVWECPLLPLPSLHSPSPLPPPGLGALLACLSFPGHFSNSTFASLQFRVIF